MVNTKAPDAGARRSLFARFKRKRVEGVVVPRSRAVRKFSGARLIAILAVLAVGATALSAGIGYDVARRSDENLWSIGARRCATRLRNSALFGQSGSLDHVLSA